MVDSCTEAKMPSGTEIQIYIYIYHLIQAHGLDKSKTYVGNIASKLMSAMVLTSSSVSPSPNGGCARRSAYSPVIEFRKGRVSSVWAE